jgi:RimJ/RimL family protein N-acetyltransferase
MANWARCTATARGKEASDIHQGHGVLRHTETLGYWLGQDFWSRGIMTEAVGALGRLVQLFRRTALIISYRT